MNNRSYYDIVTNIKICKKKLLLLYSDKNVHLINVHLPRLYTHDVKNKVEIQSLS